jgi:hypothetical protein
MCSHEVPSRESVVPEALLLTVRGWFGARGYLCHQPETSKSVTISSCKTRSWNSQLFGPGAAWPMEVLTSKATRRSTRIRVEIPVSVISLDRTRPFGDRCMVLIVSAQGCGFRCSEALQIETPIMLSGLPGGGSVTARVANCLPLGNDGKYFLIGASLYTQGNVWGIADPPKDWSAAAHSDATPSPANPTPTSAPTLTVNKKVWPYNLFSEGAEAHPGRK